MISESKIFLITSESPALSRVSMTRGSGFLGHYSVRILLEGTDCGPLCVIRWHVKKPAAARTRPQGNLEAVAECPVLHANRSSLPSTALRP